MSCKGEPNRNVCDLYVMSDLKSRLETELLTLSAYEGDREAFNKLVVLWNKKLIYQAHLRLDDWDQAQDIVQDVWQWLIKNRRKLRDVQNFSAWIRTIVDRRSVDWLRKENKKQELRKDYGDSGNTIDSVDADDSAIAGSTEKTPVDLLRASFRFLKPEMRLILNLYYHEGESVNSISQILGIPTGTVKSRLFTAREKLKSIIKQHSNEKSNK